MNKFILPFLTSISLLTFATANAQCKRFTRQRVINTLDKNIMLDQVAAGTLGRGESAATVIEVRSPGVLDLIISTHPDLGTVQYSVVDTQGRLYKDGTIQGQLERLSVESDGQGDLIIHIQSEKASGAYTPLGCVALATTRPISSKNDMDILTSE